ncbi:MAG: hypothetical protein CYPHOPRED_003378 [Cyphobasidiales sp. Tagirdzhanova-0007]|nr:MAG: hypothetical protein CYPHOPRED_003378 [Cyphobasidiales sp. Tagirdzhanova-0007]
MGYTMWGPIGREVTGVLYIIAYVLVAGNGILGCAISLNALSDHATCTVAWSVITVVFCVAVACLPKFSQIGWLTWLGCFLIITSVFILTIAVGVRSRPAAAPQTGPYELGFKAFNNPGFVLGMTASDVFFVSSAGTSSFLPVMAEMRNPHDYRKSIALGMIFTTCSYLVFSLVIYRYTGLYISSPALGSAGSVVKKVTYGLAFPSLLITTILVLHLSSKYVFVRLLRGTRHLQEKTLIHWSVWIGSTLFLGVIAFIVAEAIPFFNQLLGLIGSICFGPIGLMLPACIWFYDHGHYRKQGMLKRTYYILNGFLLLLGAFVTTAGTYAAVVGIKDAYKSGEVGSAFSCADDSGS